MPRVDPGGGRVVALDLCLSEYSMPVAPVSAMWPKTSFKVSTGP